MKKKKHNCHYKNHNDVKEVTEKEIFPEEENKDTETQSK